MVNWSEVVTDCLISLMSHIPLVDFDCEFLNIVDIKIGDRLLSFALSELCETSNSNKEGSLAYALLMLI